MRALRLALGAAVIAAAALLGLSAPATAGSPGAETFHGSFTGVSFDSTSEPADGDWTVVWRGDAVVAATFNIFVDGSHHLSYGLPGSVLTPITSPPDWSFSFPIAPAVSPNPLVVTLTGGQLTYAMHDYTWDGTHYDDVTYFGKKDVSRS